MGSAGSHGIQLTPVRTTTYSTNKHYQGRRINHYAHPHNRVLPPPVAGQRLRSTDNGSILQEKGTIRGQRTGGSPLPSEVDTEFLRVLQRRSERSLDGGKNTSIGNKWQSYSDPNITYSLQITDSSKKSKSSKKARAPAPPSQKKRNGKKMKNPAPPPPIVAVVHSVTPKHQTLSKLTVAQEGTNILFPDSHPNESRHIILEKRNHLFKNDSVRNSITESRIHINEAFTEEIREATKKIAERMGKVARRNSSKYDKHKDGKTPKQYYFPDVEVKKKGKQGDVKVDEAVHDGRKLANPAVSSHGPKTKKDQIETNEQPKLHNRIAYQQPPVREWESERNSVASSSCYSDTLPSLSGSDDDDINLKLRPTLPRRQLELPRFSPTEAWKFLGIPSLDMHKESVPSSEGEDEERVWRINKLTSPKAAILERCEDSGISPDAESPVMSKDKYNIPNKQQQTIVIGQHSWIPQQDLLEDSDSNEFDDCIRNRRFVRVPVKLALPNDMFCSKLNNFTNKTVNHNDPEQRENRIRHRRNITKNTKQGDGLSNIKKTLGMRTRNPYTEKLDSNWLLNQKNGKNYRFIGNYNYVNSGGRKQLQSLIFGVKKEKEEQRDKISCGEGGLRRKFSFYSTEGHVIYLPEYETVDLMRKQTKRREMERKHSSRRKKASDKKTIGMTEINRLDSDEWLLQMQKQHKRERDREKINIRDKLKMYQIDRHTTPKMLDEDLCIRSHSFEDLSDRQEDDSSPLQGGEWKSTPAELNNLHPLKVESSTSSPSSPEIAQSSARKPFTGASKWMRRQRQPPPQRNFSPARPEPEGGGASSDENRHTTDDTPTDNSQSPITRNPSVYTQLMEMAKEEEKKLRSEEQLNASQLKDSSRPEITETEPKHKFNFEKEGAESSWKFKTVYPNTEINNDKNVPNKPKENYHPRAKTFYMELEERMKQITQQSQNKETDCRDDDTKISRRGNGIVKNILPNVVVNEGGYKSVIQLSSVQPFVPNKGYRPVPFKMPTVQKGSENNSAELTVPKDTLKT